MTSFRSHCERHSRVAQHRTLDIVPRNLPVTISQVSQPQVFPTREVVKSRFYQGRRRCAPRDDTGG
jgi:hypothetical protein